MLKTFRYRLYPNPSQERKMLQTLRECRNLYNHLLAQRRDAYEQTGKSPTLYAQLRIDGNNRVFLSKIGHLKAVIHRPLEGTVKTATIRKSAAGKWFVCFSCEVEAEPLPESKEAVGVDMGLKDIIATSEGESVAAPRFLRKEEKELARTGRRLCEAPKGSRERVERHKVVAKVHERIKNKRSNFTHQQSRKLVDRYGFIAVEDLSVNRMNKNHCLAKSIADAAWTDLTNKLTYKAEWAGRVLVKVNPAYTSQECSCCGYRQVMPLWERVYRCKRCGLSLDRDTNAARNILTLGLKSRASLSQEAPCSLVGGVATC